MSKPAIGRDVHICVMGVSGVGKSTVGAELAARSGRSFGDADDLHPRSNVEAMAAGTPLTDTERGPWLDAVVAWLDERSEDTGGVVFACSALKRRYRDRLAEASAPVFFLHLTADTDELRRRMTERKGHFMHVDMLESQLADLEPIEADENGLEIPTSGSVTETVDAILARIRAV
ncbi:gluconokinase [Williamsia phyllosphaerae]|uniref:Gluconokinase n=1 Tax=Williamsia phyllosphaerae TaxID=885042 RepID=A0ABQ1V773_9NOCA|nr:gluconokinase [Williamsia phyllosphaerae]GGF42308.1 gluconokinase [Williamsia phyllosphaerae]